MRPRDAIGFLHLYVLILQIIIIITTTTIDIVMSVDTSIRQQLINTQMYRKEKLQENVEEINCRVCSNDQETVSHILCGCSKMALHKNRHDRMLRPLYHGILEKYE